MRNKSRYSHRALGILLIFAIVIPMIFTGCGKFNLEEFIGSDNHLYENDSREDRESHNDEHMEEDSSESSESSTDNSSHKGYSSDAPTNNNTPTKPKVDSIEELCFYSGDYFHLSHCSSKEDVFGATHYNVIYNSFSENYNDPDYYEYFTKKYYLAGEYSYLTFNTFTQSGFTDEHASIFVYVSYGGPDEETLVYSDDFYGGLPPKAVSIDLTGVTYLYITITPYNCNSWGHSDCRLCAGDFVLK